MPFLTQVRQVLQQDAREARWALVAFVATLGYAVVQGRQLLEPLPIIDDSFRVPTDWSTATVVVAPLVTFLLAGLVALTFAPAVGTSRHRNQAWRTLPIEPNAVWLARVLWVLAAAALALAVAWLALLPLPITAGSRLSIAASVAMSTVAIMLAGAMLASVAASVRTFLGWILLTPVLLFVVPLLMLLLPEDGSMVNVGIDFERSARSISNVHVFGLALLSTATLWALLRARRLGWLARGGVGAVALCLLWANILRTPAPAQTAVGASLPTLVAVTTPQATLDRVSGTNTMISRPNDGRDTSTDLVRDNAAFRASAATGLNEPPHFALRFEPQLVSRAGQDRVVFRPRAATVYTAGVAWRFSTVPSDRIVAPGDPSLGAHVRWLNARPPGVQTTYARATRQPSDMPGLARSTASLTIDVERQQPVVLAQLPLDGSPASGPWRRFVRAQLTAPADSEHTVRVSLARLSGMHALSASDEAATGELTYALLHPVRGEAVYLTTRRHFTSSVRGWALAPSLFDAVHAGLYPAGTTPSTMRDVANAEWLRGATLVVIGWRTVERGAIALEAPLAAPVAMR
jgi:hypothetical protein